MTNRWAGKVQEVEETDLRFCLLTEHALFGSADRGAQGRDGFGISCDKSGVRRKN